MPKPRPAAGGGRWIPLDPARLPRWLDGFADRHGAPLAWSRIPDGAVASAPDGARAECHLPFGWPAEPATGDEPGTTAPVLGAGPAGTSSTDGASALGADSAGTSGAGVAALVAAAVATRRVGLLLVRRGAHAVGVADGDRLVTSKVDTRYVQGRTAAGGWSQQRFARRRDKQTRESTEAAADHAARLLSSEPTLSGLVLGGDRALLSAVLDDPRLRPVAALPRVELPDVPEPRRATLVEVARRYREVRIRLTEPGD
ncbi:acVLRF1 family peptidyl-tRNA hydrolase [Actinocatenispora sera]|uniref:acVLRF1 family peptidyl-tRNA hydrolase n=1 Tax=Actinocatenispora sera TaxID=390989 RepID=UPI0033C2520E